MSVDVQAIERQILGDVWTSNEIYENLRHLCDKVGVRFGGTGGEHAGALYLLRKMQDYGLQQPRLDKFPVYTWDRGECELIITILPVTHIPAIAMPFSGSGEYRGEMIDLGEGEAEDFARAGSAVRNKIVVSAAETNRPGEVSLHRTDKYRLAVEAGAVAYIMINKNPGLLHITGSLYARNPGGPDDTDHEAPIPAIGLTYEAGDQLRRILAEQRKRALIRLSNTTRLSHSYNVLGDIPGGEKPEEVIVIGGHYDSHDICHGAGDDGAGTLVGVEVGRLLAPYAGQLKRTIRVICFGYEELGLGGSFHHADYYTSEDCNETLMMAVNLDGAGRGEGGQERVNVTGDAALANYFRQMKHDMKYDFATANRISVHSDHYPFFLKGFPSITLNSADSTAGMIGRGYGHTEGDTFDKIHPRGLQMGAAFAARVALQLAMADEFPAQRRDEEAVHTALADSGQAHFLQHHWGRANRAT